ncbi:MAG: DUF2949 domain-containing protein [Cyanobacteria bacterium J06639_14]
MSTEQTTLFAFLTRELGVPAEAIALGLKQSAATPNLLPMVLWQYGLVTTHQLDQIFAWLEAGVS